MVSRDPGEMISQFPSDRALAPRAVDAPTQAEGEGDGFYGEMDEDVITHSVY